MRYILSLIFICTTCFGGVSKELPSSDQLTVSMIIKGGSRVQLSDGSIYAIDPDDQIYSALWLTPSRITIGTSKSKDFPVLITDEISGTSVKGRKMTDDEMLNERKNRTTEEAKKPQPPVYNAPAPAPPKPAPAQPMRPSAPPPPQSQGRLHAPSPQVQPQPPKVPSP